MEDKKIQYGRIPSVTVLPADRAKPWEGSMWHAFLSVCLLAGALLALLTPWGKTLALGPLPWCFGISAMACTMLGRKKRHKIFSYLWILPWVGVLISLAYGNPLYGGTAWVNEVISRWNTLHADGLRALPGTASADDCRVFVIWSCTLFGTLIGMLFFRKRPVFCTLICALALWVELISGRTSNSSIALLTAGLLGYLVSDEEVFAAIRAGYSWMLLTAALLAVSLLLPTTAAPEVSRFRQQVKSEVHDLRYGAVTFPQGDLRKASTLNGKSAPLLTIRTEQLKDGYLPAFYGNTYTGGSWKETTSAAYGGDYAGMFNWLNARGFYPQTQVADYYALTEEVAGSALTLPSSNFMDVQVSGACREILYAPASLESYSTNSARVKLDWLPQSRGLLGQRSYTYSERSSARPGELTVAEDWVSNPQTQGQTDYLQSEAVYRSFVYDTYTRVNPLLEARLKTLFQKDTELEGDGIFTVLTHVRKVLSSLAPYTRTPGACPAGVDPLMWFLNGNQAGNAMLFASAGVQALRLYGIPARYVEGLRYSAADFSASGEQTLTGQNAHAWVEVYFDGVGWIPVDVTPGFYYDMRALQRLVKIPEDAQRTSAVLDNGNNAREVPDTQEQTGDNTDGTRGTNLLNLLHILRSLLLTAALLGVVLLAALELIRLGWLLVLRRRYQSWDAQQRAWLLEQLLFRFLACCGMAGSLGWNTEEMDALLSEKFRAVDAGEYRRNCRILEKSIYGQIPPEVYEERTLRGFVTKIYRADDWRARIRCRYAWIGV